MPKSSGPRTPKQERDRRYDAKRREQQPWHAWYKLPIWQSIRAHQLGAHPLCARHLKRKQYVPATVCNHVIRHQGDWALFIAGPFESLCKACHDRDAQSEEQAHPRGCDQDGRPLDPTHPWAQGASE